MMPAPLISVCIPAYKNPEYLDRLLKSALEQDFQDFEVIVTDDSPDGSVHELIQQHRDKLNITYHKNTPAAGSPGNWNTGIRLAKGKWIKLMHDDDWFSLPASLGIFVQAIHANPSASFIFSAYENISSNGARLIIRPESFRMKQLSADPVTLLSKNIIGPPSVVIHKNDQHHFYDERMQWLVDMDFYMRYLADTKPVYIDQSLINIGLNELQVTRSSSLVREVEIPEHFLVLEKTGVNHLRNILVYDAWWRLFRNLGIRSVSEIAEAGYQGKVPMALVNIIGFQNRFKMATLKKGFVSKSLMMLSYTSNKLKGLLA